MRWFIADTHFGHKNIIEYENRPFNTVKDMDNHMIQRWNELVNDDDEVFFLGDFGLESIFYLRNICSTLKGIKILIRGNHDGSVSKMKAIGFKNVMEQVVIKIHGTAVYLSHIPIPDHLLGLMYAERGINLHGHMHSKGTNHIVDNKLCVSVELWDYRPVSEEEIRKELNLWRKHANH